MAYSRKTKYDAMELYAAGSTLSQIAEQMDLGKATLSEWHGRKIPQDWDLFREEVEQKRTVAISDRLAKAKSELGLRHLEMWDRVAEQFSKRVDLSTEAMAHRRQLLLHNKRALYDEVTGKDGQGTGEFTPRVLGPGELAALTSAATRVVGAEETAELAATAARIQAGQRTILGQQAYYVGVEATAGAGAAPHVFLPPESADGSGPPAVGATPVTPPPLEAAAAPDPDEQVPTPDPVDEPPGD